MELEAQSHTPLGRRLIVNRGTRRMGTAKVDITLVELAEMLRCEHGARFAPSTVWRFLDRHAMTLKKN